MHVLRISACIKNVRELCRANTGIFTQILKNVLNFLVGKSGYQQPKSGCPSNFSWSRDYQATANTFSGDTMFMITSVPLKIMVLLLTTGYVIHVTIEVILLFSKCRKLEKEKEKSTTDYRQQLVTQSQLLGFGKTVGHLRQLVQELPSDLTICQVI